MTYVQGDNGVVIPFSTGLDLTGSTVYVTIRRSGIITEKTATVIDGLKGNCQFTLLSADINKFGWYLYQWSVHYDDGRILSEKPFKFYVEKRLSGQIADTTPPNDASNLSTSNVGSTSLLLTWTASTSADVASYAVYNGNTLLGNVTNPLMEITGLIASTPYTFTVKTINTNSISSVGVSVNVTTSAPSVDTTPPNDVTNLTTSNITTTGVTLSWTASTSNDVANYEIYNGPNLIADTTNTSYVITGLSPDAAYTLVVKVVDSSGNISNGISINVTTSSTTAVVGTAAVGTATVA